MNELQSSSDLRLLADAISIVMYKVSNGIGAYSFFLSGDFDNINDSPDNSMNTTRASVAHALMSVS